MHQIAIKNGRQTFTFSECSGKRKKYDCEERLLLSISVAATIKEFC